MTRHSLAAFVALFALGHIGCGPPANITELEIQVVVDDDGVLVTPREVERHCTCSAGERPELGSCGNSSDAVQCNCDPAPASCIERILIEKDGEEIVGENELGEWYGFQYLSIEDAGSGSTLIVEGCGGVAVIPLDSEEWPIPTIAETSQTGGTLDAEWSTSPSATSVIASLSNGFVATLCHDQDDGEESFGLGYPGTYWVTVHALTSRVVETELGNASVWAGGTDSIEVDVLDY